MFSFYLKICVLILKKLIYKNFVVNKLKLFGLFLIFLLVVGALPCLVRVDKCMIYLIESAYIGKFFLLYFQNCF